MESLRINDGNVVIQVQPHSTLDQQYKFLRIYNVVVQQQQQQQQQLPITIVALNRPNRHNAIHRQMWYEIGHVFTQFNHHHHHHHHQNNDNNDTRPTSNPLLTTSTQTRVIILLGIGKSFCSGIDISDTEFLFSAKDDNYNSQRLLPKIQQMQECFTALEQCPIPIIAVVHGYCIGAGMDLLCCTDIRICCTGNDTDSTSSSSSSSSSSSPKTVFAIKEVQMGFAPDVGTLQRLPKICGSNQSMIHELCYTGRNFDSNEAIEIGLVSQQYCRSTLEECIRTAIVDISYPIIRSNPNAISNIKRSLLYSRHHPNVEDGLHHIANINSIALLSDDVRLTLQQQQQRTLRKRNMTEAVPSTAEFPNDNRGGSSFISKTISQLHSKL